MANLKGQNITHNGTSKLANGKCDQISLGNPQLCIRMHATSYGSGSAQPLPQVLNSFLINKISVVSDMNHKRAHLSTFVQKLSNNVSYDHPSICGQQVNEILFIKSRLDTLTNFIIQVCISKLLLNYSNLFSGGRGQ